MALSFTLPVFFALKGIIHKTSCLYTQQIGVVERNHQHLLNVGRALKFQSNLPLLYWRYCIQHANLLININPHLFFKASLLISFYTLNHPHITLQEFLVVCPMFALLTMADPSLILEVNNVYYY